MAAHMILTKKANRYRLAFSIIAPCLMQEVVVVFRFGVAAVLAVDFVAEAAVDFAAAVADFVVVVAAVDVAALAAALVQAAVFAGRFEAVSVDFGVAVVLLAAVVALPARHFELAAVAFAPSLCFCGWFFPGHANLFDPPHPQTPVQVL